VLVASTLGRLWPGVFGAGDTVAAVLLGSAGLWIFHFLIARGVQEAAAINKIVTYAKVVPILTFIVVAIFALKAHVFSANFWGGEPRTAGALFGQVRATMLVTVFVFLGIEGASVYSRYAKKRSDVGRATVLGFLGVLALFASVTIFSYGILPRAGLEPRHGRRIPPAVQDLPAELKRSDHGSPERVTAVRSVHSSETPTMFARACRRITRKG
jgi:arginine:ornithine antiporter/lysine permease